MIPFIWHSWNATIIEKRKQSSQQLWDNIQESKQRNIFKDNSQIISKLKEPHQSTDQAQRTPSRTDAKIWPKRKLFKLLKTKDGEENLKAARKGKKGIKLKITTDFLSETMQVGRLIFLDISERKK